MNTLKEKFFSITDDKIKKNFEIYYNLLKEWNEKFNLTAIKDKEQIYIKHFADSLAAEDLCEGRLLDIGAGAGFPSVPLKIKNPSLKIVMADSLNKRIIFLNEVINKLDLKNCVAIHTRAEDIKEKESFDTVVARAVAPLDTLVEYMLPFVKIGGKAIAYKSADVGEEVKRAEKAIRKLGGGKIEMIKIKLDEDTERSLVVIEKTEKCPLKYPRGGNKPRLDPIK